VGWRDVIKLLNRQGFSVVHQRGSHIYLRDQVGKHKVSVPRQDPIKIGTLLSIIEQAGLTREEFIKMISE
jgi:predicted RNA binding protein YcfA (HicA-like mRNA interferase family)